MRRKRSHRRRGERMRPLYQRKNKLKNATTLQKAHSKSERRRRQAKIDKCKALISTRIYKIRINHYCELLKVVKEDHPDTYKDILSKVPKLKKTKEMKLEFYKSQYKVDGTSIIRGWIKKQIDKMEAKKCVLVATGEGEGK